MDTYHATAQTFDALVFEPEDELVVVDFWGPNCPNCDVFKAHLPALLLELEGAPVRLVTCNAYQEREIATRFSLFGVPTFILVKNGKVLGKMTRFYGKEYWLGVVRDHLLPSPTLTAS